MPFHPRGNEAAACKGRFLIPGSLSHLPLLGNSVVRGDTMDPSGLVAAAGPGRLVEDSVTLFFGRVIGKGVTDDPRQRGCSEITPQRFFRYSGFLSPAPGLARASQLLPLNPSQHQEQQPAASRAVSPGAPVQSGVFQERRRHPTGLRISNVL